MDLASRFACFFSFFFNPSGESMALWLFSSIDFPHLVHLYHLLRYDAMNRPRQPLEVASPVLQLRAIPRGLFFQDQWALGRRFWSNGQGPGLGRNPVVRGLDSGFVQDGLKLRGVDRLLVAQFLGNAVEGLKMALQQMQGLRITCANDP